MLGSFIVGGLIMLVVTIGAFLPSRASSKDNDVFTDDRTVFEKDATSDTYKMF